MISFLIFLIFVYYSYQIMRRKLSTPKFTGKTIWITGASSGIGQSLAYQFAHHGVGKLIISARNLEQLERVKKNCSYPDRVETLKMDMVNFEQVRNITKQIITKLQSQQRELDIVIQNAGIAMRSDFINFSFENHKQIFNVNVHGVVNHIQAFLPHMIKNNNGQIVTISSILGKYSVLNRSSYTASKFAINGIADSLRTQLYPYGIQVTNILPGLIKTNVAANSFASGSKQKYGKKDEALFSKAMEASDFAREAVKAIYRKQNQCHISRQWIKNPLLILLRGVCPDLSFYWSRRELINKKGQKQQ